MMPQILKREGVRLAGKAIRHPRRAALRLVLRARLARLKMREERARLLSALSARFGVDARTLLADYRRSEFHQRFQQRRSALDRFDGPYRFGTTMAFGCEALYLLVRALRPRLVVETGVLYGASSAHILAALAQNGRGELRSIDLGRDPREPPHDYFIPPELQPRWELVIGDSRDELPRVLRRCESIDLFHHDSLHTWEHMTWEYETALPYLSSRGVLSSDDILSSSSITRIFRQNAFPAFCRRWRMPYATFHNLGIAIPGAGKVAAPKPRPRVSTFSHGVAGWAPSRSWVISPSANA